MSSRAAVRIAGEATGRPGRPGSEDVFPKLGRKNQRAGWRGRLALRLLPRHTQLMLLHELHLTWVRLFAPFVRWRYRNSSGILVNVACGPYGQEGWVNVDALRLPGVDCVYDCRSSLPFPDGSVRGIFCEHFLEHLDYDEEAPVFLAECHRALERGGRLRIVVPDGEAYLRAYGEGGWESLSRIRPLGEDRSDAHVGCAYNVPMELVNVVFRQAFQHRFAYDSETLAALLRRAGFDRIGRSTFGESGLPGPALDHPARASESLYVEATK